MEKLNQVSNGVALHKGTTTETTGQVIEFAPFILKEGVNEVALLEASRVLQRDFLVDQPGFMKRELVKKSETDYVDIVYWQNQATADKAMQKAMNSPVCFAYFQLMKEADHNIPAEGVSHYEIVSSYV